MNVDGRGMAQKMGFRVGPGVGHEPRSCVDAGVEPGGSDVMLCVFPTCSA